LRLAKVHQNFISQK